MALGTQKQRIRPVTLWIDKQEFPASAAHPVPPQRRERLEAERFAKTVCQQFHAEKIGRLSLTIGICLRGLLIRCFQGIFPARGIAARVTDLLTIRHFVAIGLGERSCNHLSLSGTRRMIAAEGPEQVFGFVLRVVIRRCPLKRAGIVAEQDHWRGRHHPRSQQGKAEYRSLGHRRPRPAVSNRIDDRVGHRNAEVRAVIPAGPEAEAARLE
jgi:hypothetical protein